MHELGIIFEVVKTVRKFAEENGITKIDTLVLQIGEISPIVPKYIEEAYPAAVDRTPFEDMKLKIEIVPSNGRCNNCSTNFNLLEHEGNCPSCGKKDFEVLSGREFMIKEIIAC